MSDEQPKSISYSAMNTFVSCPRKYYATKVTKEFSDANYWNTDGAKKHKAVEMYLKAGAPLPAELAALRPFLDRLKAMPGELMTEMPMCVSRDFRPARWKDWANGWLRAKADVLVMHKDTHLVHYVDWKFGKFHPDDDQIRLTGFMLFNLYPDIQKVKGLLYFANSGQSHPCDVYRTEMAAIWNEWAPIIDEMREAYKTDKWEARPSGLCAYCPVLNCPHNKNRRA